MAKTSSCICLKVDVRVIGCSKATLGEVQDGNTRDRIQDNLRIDPPPLPCYLLGGPDGLRQDHFLELVYL